MKIIILIALIFLSQFKAYGLSGAEIFKKVAQNLTFSSARFEVQLKITIGPQLRWKKLNLYLKDDNLGYAEIIAPASEMHTRYLKMNNHLLINLPGFAEKIKIENDLLEAAFEASDFSYRELLENTRFAPNYNAKLVAETGNAYVLELIPKFQNFRRKIWVDKDKFVPLKQEIYDFKGKLIKIIEMTEIFRTGNRYYPAKITAKDLTRVNSKTELMISKSAFDIYISPAQFIMRD